MQRDVWELSPLLQPLPSHREDFNQIAEECSRELETGRHKETVEMVHAKFHRLKMDMSEALDAAAASLCKVCPRLEQFETTAQFERAQQLYLMVVDHHHSYYERNLLFIKEVLSKLVGLLQKGLKRLKERVTDLCQWIRTKVQQLFGVEPVTIL